jgi:hypothetical protein
MIHAYMRIILDLRNKRYWKTIDPSMRLIQENQILKVNIDKYEGMFDRIEMLEKRIQEKLR